MKRRQQKTINTKDRHHTIIRNAYHQEHTNQALLETYEILRPSRSEIHAPHASLTYMKRALREILHLACSGLID
jgi:hypothetical protein